MGKGSIDNRIFVIMSVTWNSEAFFAKATKGSFAAKAARVDVFKQYFGKF